MLRTVILLQLALWVASIHAFFPFIPAWRCEEGNACDDGSKSKQPKARDFQTYKLSQRVRDANEDPSATAAKEASRLLRKYKPSRATAEQPDLTRRENKYSVVEPARPSMPNSAGIYQDGTDFSYFVQIGFGSTGKPLYMLLDTGAGSTWVMGSDCKSDACTMHNSFGPADSKTYSDTSKAFQVSYGAGAVNGKLVKDTVALAGMSLSMTFGVATDTSTDFKNFPFDGILGMSMSSGLTDNFLTVVKNAGAVKSNIFGVSLNRNSDGANNGEVNFGGIDSSRYTGEITYSAVSAKALGDWAISMDDLTYDGKSVGTKGRLTYIDTGTSYVFGPPDDVAALHKLIPGAKSDDGGFTYTVPCDSNKELKVFFSGVAYTIAPQDWISPPRGDKCTSNIYGYAVVDGAWLLGDVFLKNVYSVFDADQKRIGFGARPAPPPSSSATTKADVASTTATAKSNGSSVPTLVTTATPGSSSSSSGSSFPGLSGHETSVTQGTPVAQTAGSSATPTASSPGEQLEGNRYASIICIVAVIAMVA